MAAQDLADNMNYAERSRERKKKEKEFLNKYREIVYQGLIPKLTSSKPPKFKN
jgi:hypothetical protein